MNPSSNEATPQAPVEGELSVGAPENGPNSAEKAAVPERGAKAAPPPSLPADLFSAAKVGQDDDSDDDDQKRPATAISTKGNPVQARSDKDIIEKEWVNRAKHIIESTRDDPYRQSEELTVLKADYMKKRYNKTIKIDK